MGLKGGVLTITPRGRPGLRADIVSADHAMRC
jgi:hypothetical protein